jgi:hypothetical protein
MQRGAKIAGRVLAGLGALFLMLIVLAVACRLPLAEWALRNALTDAGASPRDLKVTDLRWRHATIAPLDVDWHAQRLRVEALTIDRPDLFGRSLGHVEARGITATLDLAALMAAGQAPPAAAGGRTGKAEPAAPRISFDDLLVQGRLVLRAPQAEQALTLLLSAKPDATGNGVQVDLVLTGPGLDAKAKGHYDFARSTAEFELPGAEVDLAKAWGFLQPIAPAACRGWEIGGRMTLVARGQLVENRLTGEVVVHLRDGSVGDPGAKLSARGIEADVVFSDPARLATGPAQALRVKEAEMGDVSLRDAVVRFQLNGLHSCQVESGGLAAFGGRLSVEPFACDPAAGSGALVVLADGLRMDDVLALFPDAPAKASGVIDGRVPITYDGTGLHFGSGWVGLKEGQAASVRFNSTGLLTRSLSPQNPAYATLEGIESGRTPLSVEELRVELHPPAAPPGRSAQIRIVGRPEDRGSRLGRVTLDLNINGPLEALLNWGMQAGVSVTTGRPQAAETKIERN